MITLSLSKHVVAIVADFPKSFKDLGTVIAEEAVVEYRMRLSHLIAEEKARRSGKVDIIYSLHAFIGCFGCMCAYA